MQKHPKKTVKSARSHSSFQVRPVRPGEVASIVLQELTRDYPHYCNYLHAADLAQKGEIYLALCEVMDSNSRFTEVANATQVWAHAQATAVLKKLVDPDIERWTKTKEVWFRTEKRMRRVNKKFRLLATDLSLTKNRPFTRELARFDDALRYALGTDCPVEELLELAHYGPGSTTGVRGTNINYARKIECGECVPSAVQYAARALLHDKAIWEQYDLRPEYSHLAEAREGFIRIVTGELQKTVVVADRLMFIHKNIEDLRSIGAQPTVSGSLQLGFHTYMCELFPRLGIDLADQTWNQSLARSGSLNWRTDDPMCTLDASNASNSTACELVRTRFPAQWAKFLMDTRTPCYDAPEELGGGQHMYEMYAGMGNGTTFAVETLVFWAAVYATQDLPMEEFIQKRRFAIYGDDVVIPRSHATRYIPFFKYLGYTLNAGKSFLEGPFRESCGADYYAGLNVRAAYLNTDAASLSWTDIVGFHNTLVDQRNFPLPGAAKRIRDLWKTRIYPLLPTDPQGDLGFRPTKRAGYDLVRGKGEAPAYSVAWQRPRYYVLDKRAKHGDLGEIGVYTQFAVALLRARQAGGLKPGAWSLPVRDAENIRVVAERDMERRDLVTMLRNTLLRVANRKATPWWKDHRGL